ncbi:hypothetical protein FCIRC_3846 [Fusarium circinatum]|uniref:Uncharacterized protein n=1 Tax=Fusarium circinatum TaxID=48490 RepID=A0A8H5U846_FUSCI|nr:hypothetical protein FCIRC_3846 [Fusarium circinatum]
MFQPITVVLTTTQTCIAGVAMLIAFLNFGWTIYSKQKDWQIAEDERRRKDSGNAAAVARAVTKQEVQDLRDRLDTTLKELKTTSDGHNALDKAYRQFEGSRGPYETSINDKLNGLEARLKTMEDSRCQCNAARFQELVDDVQTLKSEKAQLEKDAITKATDKLTEATKALTESYQSAANPKDCKCGQDKKEVKVEPLRRVQSSKSVEKAAAKPRWR